ncbi:putative ankyrin and HET domain protein [Rosellinia necatrix]|uniref:Putative ankyrin and HET domain protein n=1 Tax=Rosellinia necatrix TaxID=77044 RepID=A0A1W2TN50_ROSNE|nr:putative ankyrin and HET domain protein [Rosellinia necatrix]
MDDLASAPGAPSDGDHSPPIAHGYKKPRPYPYYNYTPLPDGWIRLVRIHQGPLDNTLSPDLDEDLHVTLHDYPLSSCPDYIALSYTWGEPTVSPDPAYRIFTQEPRCFPINCGGRLLRSTRNLRAALRYLRWGQRILQDDDALNRNAENVEALYQTLGSSRLLDLYWIDALCIDQDDLFERSTQVSQMGEIYKKASLCVIWLGEVNDSAGSGMKLLVELALSQQLSDAFTKFAASRSVDDKSNFRRVFNNIINTLPTDRIIELATFLSYTWFSRIWVLQEAALAPKIAVLCGPLFFDVSALITPGKYIELASGSIPLLASTGSDLREDVGPGLPETAKSLTRTPMMLTMLGSIRDNISRGTMPKFLDLITATSRSESTDPRDRIYGVLAITTEFQSGSERAIHPDYALPVHIVYIQATSYIASRHKQLGFLNFVCQTNRKTIPGLPSWCPDYTNIPASLFPLGSGIDGRDYTALLWDRQLDIEVLDEKLLAVHGFCYDTIDKIAHDVKGLLALALGVDRNQHNDHLRRLLIQDKLHDETPAPKAVGLYFPAIIGILMALSKLSSQNDELEGFIHIITEFRLLEPKSHPFLPDIDLMREIFDGENFGNMDPEHDVIYFMRELLLIPRRAREANLLSDLKQLLGLGQADISERDLAHQAMMMFKENIMQGITKLMLEKCFFITKSTERFALGGSLAKMGDEVWILHGASKPVLLRPLENRNYEYLGPVYVYGIMGDEIKNEVGSPEFRKVYIE